MEENSREAWGGKACGVPLMAKETKLKSCVDSEYWIVNRVILKGGRKACGVPLMAKETNLKSYVDSEYWIVNI